MTEAIIEQRFNGPPSSANGGYACGVAAMLFGRPSIVTLTAPPPLGVEVRLEGDGSNVIGPAGSWASVQRLDDPIETVAPISLEEARAAAARFDLDSYRDGHAFPTCFTCGPDRTADDGLGIFPAEHPSRAGVVVWPWSPKPAHSEDGRVDDRIVWAALDCPSGLAWFGAVDEVFVLGRMAARIARPPAVGEELVTAGWRVDRDGRRLHAGSAIWDQSGQVVAAARSTWFTLTGEQAAAFGSAKAG